MAGLEDLNHNFLTGRLEDLVKWARRNSMWPATFGLACCAIEMMATGGANYDLSRFGMEVFRASPRQADLMIVAGRVSQKMAPVLRQVYDQMMEPKWVISMGVCASSGGMFNNYAIVQGVDQIVPVDVYAPGCPPGPETLIHAILTLHERSGPARSPSAARRGRRRRAPRRAAVLRPSRPSPSVADDDRHRDRRGHRRARARAGARPRLPPVVTDPRGQRVVFAARTQYARRDDALQGRGLQVLRPTSAPSTTSPTPAGPARRRRRPSASSSSSTCVDEARTRLRVRCQVPESDPTVRLFEL